MVASTLGPHRSHTGSPTLSVTRGDIIAQPTSPARTSPPTTAGARTTVPGGDAGTHHRAERTSAVQLNRRSPPSRQGRRGDLLMAPRAVGHGCRRARRAAWRSEPIAPSRASRTACRRGRLAPSSTVLQRPGGPSHHRRSCRRDLPCIPASGRPPGSRLELSWFPTSMRTPRLSSRVAAVSCRLNASTRYDTVGVWGGLREIERRRRRLASRLKPVAGDSAGRVGARTRYEDGSYSPPASTSRAPPTTSARRSRRA